MNVQLLAAALRAFADALVTPASETVAAPAATEAPKKPRGRPPAGGHDAPPAAVAPAATSANPIAPAATPPASAPAAETKPLTHADVQPIFIAAAKAKGRDFVVTIMREFGAETFDKVKGADLPKMVRRLKGEEEAPPPAAAADPMADLLG